MSDFSLAQNALSYLGGVAALGIPALFVADVAAKVKDGPTPELPSLSPEVVDRVPDAAIDITAAVTSEPIRRVSVSLQAMNS